MSATVEAVLALAAAAAALAWALWVRELPASFAVVVALAFGVLAFMALRAVERLLPLYGRRRPPEE